MASEYDITLPFCWIAKHPLSRLYGPPDDIRFYCKNCTKEIMVEFSIEYKNVILHYPEALMIGSLNTPESNENLLDSIPEKFRTRTHMMSKKAAKCLPEHMLYHHLIDLKQGKTPPWGPCYALSEKELEVL
jgi:hypothetical protein